MSELIDKAEYEYCLELFLEVLKNNVNKKIYIGRKLLKILYMTRGYREEITHDTRDYYYYGKELCFNYNIDYWEIRED